MRILHVIPAIAPRYGGPSAATIGLCRALNAAGVTTLVATTNADGDRRLPVATGREVSFGGVSAIVFPRVWSEAYKWSPQLAAWLDRHVAEFDLVHVHAVFSHSSLAAAAACRRTGVPYIVRPLGTLDPWSVSHKRTRKRALLWAGGGRMLREARGIHYTSSEEQRLAEGVIPDLPTGYVVPLGVDDVLFEDATVAPSSDAAPYVLSLSRLDPKKGIELVIGAFHQVVSTSTLTHWRLVIAGNGDPAFVQSLEAAAAAGPAHERITFAGWVDGPRKRELIHGAGAYILASHQENFGISVAEAMAAGVPVIVTPGVNLAGDIIRSGAGWVPERTLASIVDSLRTALSDSEARRERGAAARRLAEAFRWPTIASSLIQMYSAVSAPCGVAVASHA